MDYKSLIGQTIYLTPTGNKIDRNAKGGAFSQVTTATVKSVGRAFVTITKENGGDTKCRIVPNSPSELSIDGINGGYSVYLSEQEIDIKRRASSAKIKLINDLHSLTYDELIKIAEVLGWQ